MTKTKPPTIADGTVCRQTAHHKKRNSHARPSIPRNTTLRCGPARPLAAKSLKGLAKKVKKLTTKRQT